MNNCVEKTLVELCIQLMYIFIEFVIFFLSCYNYLIVYVLTFTEVLTIYSSYVEKRIIKRIYKSKGPAVDDRKNIL